MIFELKMLSHTIGNEKDAINLRLSAVSLHSKYSRSMDRHANRSVVIFILELFYFFCSERFTVFRAKQFTCRGFEC